MMVQTKPSTGNFGCINLYLTKTYVSSQSAIAIKGSAMMGCQVMEGAHATRDLKELIVTKVSWETNYIILDLNLLFLLKNQV